MRSHIAFSNLEISTNIGKNIVVLGPGSKPKIQRPSVESTPLASYAYISWTPTSPFRIKYSLPSSPIWLDAEFHNALLKS